MKSNEIYNAWKEQKSQAELKVDFPDKVMRRISELEQRKRTPLFDWNKLMELVFSNPLAKAAMIAMGALVGAVRIAIMLYAFLWC